MWRACRVGCEPPLWCRVAPSTRLCRQGGRTPVTIYTPYTPDTAPRRCVTGPSCDAPTLTSLSAHNTPRRCGSCAAPATRPCAPIAGRLHDPAAASSLSALVHRLRLPVHMRAAHVWWVGQARHRCRCETPAGDRRCCVCRGPGRGAIGVARVVPADLYHTCVVRACVGGGTRRLLSQQRCWEGVAAEVAVCVRARARVCVVMVVVGFQIKCNL